MINSIKNNISTRRGFIFGALTLILFNFLLTGTFYTMHLNNEANIIYTKSAEELNKDLDRFEKELTKENFKTYLKKYSKEYHLKIEIKNDENETVYQSDNEYKDKKTSILSITRIFDYDGKHYLITISRRQDILGLKIAIEFLVFELIIIAILFIVGLLFANKKILQPLSTLSKDVNNYKLGILPKKRKVNSNVDSIQNDFVDLVENLEEEKKKQNTIIASISHDIKTPLTSILGYSELLIKDSTSKELKEKYSNVIHNKSLVMKEIVEEFDDYLSCNIKDQRKVERITILHLVDYLNKYYKEDLISKNVEFKVKTNCPNLQIEVDLPKFKRVFSNIITNSIRHFDKEKKLLNININEQKNGKIKFEIADNGSGCKEDLKKIFNPLFTTDKGRKISGLGLSICKEIIESHNGTIRAENNKLGGFSIIFIINYYKED